MIGLDMLQDTETRKWLNGIVPAWTMLDAQSLEALLAEPSIDNSAVRLANNLTPAEIEKSAVARNTVQLLHATVNNGGLPLTATGNLTRAVVEEMRGILEWPGYNQTDEFQFHKVINEPDFLPLHFVRIVAQSAGLLRKHKGKLIATRVGKELLSPAEQGALQAIMFHLTFWLMDLSYFGRGLHGSWPQPHIGLIFWCLSVAAHDWQTPESLTRICTIPNEAILEATWDTGSMATEARVLQPLFWFGMLDRLAQHPLESPLGRQYQYRKTGLFDRLLQFDVQSQASGQQTH